MPHALADSQAALNALRGPVRLRTLTGLRWLAVGGQTLAIVIVHFGLGYPAPLGLCLGAIAASAWLNLFTMLRYSPQRFLSDREAAGYIAFDIVQLCALLFFTGGLQNPFSALIIAPVTIAASLLPLRHTVMIGALAIAGVSLLALYHMPMPWAPGETLELSPIYKAGVWTALSFTIAFFAAYAHRIAAESAQMRSALAATQLVLAREERLAALGGLAAAAAHELGTPLATIQVTAKEMQHDLAGQEDLEEDAALLVSQARRCRDILSRLSEHGEAGDAVHDRLSVHALLEEAAAPFLDMPEGSKIRIEINDDAGEPQPVLRRRPELIFGLRNFVENALGFAKDEVVISAGWSGGTLNIAVNDDGPGFSPDVMMRLGEPYVNAKSPARSAPSGYKDASKDTYKGGRKGGLGLGFFIAKTLLEATGARIRIENRQWGASIRQRGASVTAAWPVSAVAAEPIT